MSKAVNRSSTFSLAEKRTLREMAFELAHAKNKIINGTSYTITREDAGTNLICTNTAAIAIALPDGLPSGFQCTIVRAAAGTPTVTPSGTDTVNGAGGGLAPSAQWAAVYLNKFSDTEYYAHAS